MRQPFAPVLATMFWLAGVSAAYASHMDPMRQIKIGAKLVLYQPEILLLAAASGLVMSFWARRDVLIGFVAFFVGVALGFPIVFVWQIDMVWLALILIVVFGGAIAVQVNLPVRMQQAYLLLAGACCAPLALFGHHFAETPQLLLGNFVFTLFLVLSAAFLICMVIRKRSVDHWWLGIVLRVFGSWAAAAAIMVMAFYLVRPVA